MAFRYTEQQRKGVWHDIRENDMNTATASDKWGVNERTVIRWAEEETNREISKHDVETMNENERLDKQIEILNANIDERDNDLVSLRSALAKSQRDKIEMEQELENRDMRIIELQDTFALASPEQTFKKLIDTDDRDLKIKSYESHLLSNGILVIEMTLVEDNHNE